MQENYHELRSAWLHSKFKANLNYIPRPCLKTQQRWESFSWNYQISSLELLKQEAKVCEIVCVTHSWRVVKTGSDSSDHSQLLVWLESQLKGVGEGWEELRFFCVCFWACTVRGFTPQLFTLLSCMGDWTTSGFSWQSAQWMPKPLIWGELFCLEQKSKLWVSWLLFRASNN